MSPTELTLPTGVKVLANIMVGSNRATSLEGISSPLRTQEDGIRFHQVRRLAKAVIIGGNTFRCEPYQNSPLPVFVGSTTLTPMQDEKVFIAPLPPKDLIALALERFGAPVLIEGGVNFLSSLIIEKAIDLILITRVPKAGDGDLWDDQILHKYYELFREEKVSASRFEIWQPSN